MKRREAIQRMAVLMGGTFIGADGLLANTIDWDAIDDLDYSKGIGIFSKAQIKLMDEIADTILPTTSTPGAKAAKVGQFMAVMVSDCSEPAEQKIFVDGLATIQADSKKKYGKPFQKCTPQQRTEFLIALDQEQKSYNSGRKRDEPKHYFTMMKDLTLFGYFTSEIGCTQALRMVEIPGRFDACVPYQKGDRAWGGY